MFANYRDIVWRSAAVTAIVALVAIALAGAFGGGKGLLGAVLGVLLVTAFFAISVVTVGLAARRGPRAMMIAAMSVYLIKVLVLLLVVTRFSGTTAFDPRAFGLTALACILVWTGGQVFWSLRLRVLYLQPAEDSPPVSQQPVAEQPVEDR